MCVCGWVGMSGCVCMCVRSCVGVCVAGCAPVCLRELER